AVAASLERVPRKLLLVALAGALIGGAALLLLATQPGERKSADGNGANPAHAKVANTLARDVASALERYRLALADIAARADVAAALGTGDAGVLGGLASRLTPDLDGVLAL